MDMPKQGSDFGTVTCHGSCYILKGDDALMDADELPLIGQHNIVNVLAALALGRQIGLNTDSMMITIKTFKGLEHRIEWVTALWRFARLKQHGVYGYQSMQIKRCSLLAF
jgi:UDP-N-acetylmuramoylalanine--D-glutamate ligase